MNKSESIKELSSALAKAQAAIQPADMDGTGYNYKYATLGSIINAARKPLADNGLSVVQTPYNDDFSIGVRTILLHESGEYIEDSICLPIGEEKGRSLAQNAGSVISYLRRYSLASVLCIYAEEDTDGESKGKAGKASATKTTTADTAEGEPPKQYSMMTVEMAKTEKNSDGIPYVDIDSKTLKLMLGSMERVLKEGKDRNGPLTPEHTEELKRKSDAARVLLKSRE